MNTIATTATIATAREIFRSMLGRGPVSTSDLVGPGVNHRFAREVLGLLTNHGLVTEVPDDEHGTHEAYYWDSEDEALALFDQEFGTPTTPTTKKETPAVKTPKTTEIRQCACGCEQYVAGRATFRPGHDARMVGQLARDLATGDGAYVKAITGVTPAVAPSTQEQIDQVANVIRIRFSPALADKVRSAATRAWERTNRTPAQATEEVAPFPDVKVGRWTYPARRVGQVVERNTKRDGSGEWVSYGTVTEYR